jgi:hypothetical protein
MEATWDVEDETAADHLLARLALNAGEAASGVLGGSVLLTMQAIRKLSGHDWQSLPPPTTVEVGQKVKLEAKAELGSEDAGDGAHLAASVEVKGSDTFSGTRHLASHLEATLELEAGAKLALPGLPAVHESASIKATLAVKLDEPDGKRPSITLEYEQVGHAGGGLGPADGELLVKDHYACTIDLEAMGESPAAAELKAAIEAHDPGAIQAAVRRFHSDHVVTWEHTTWHGHEDKLGGEVGGAAGVKADVKVELDHVHWERVAG